MIVDYEAVVADLEAYILEKPGHSFGERELTDKIRDLRVRHRVPEGLVEGAMRLYSEEVLEALVKRPAARPPEGDREMAHGEPARIGA